MLILLALIAGCVVGLAVHFTLPHRETRGAALAPAAGTVVAGLVWTALTWAGLSETNPWLWLASFAAPLIVWPGVLALTRHRRAKDAAERVRLGIG